MKQYMTHHFAHRETLARARYWLAQLGFDPGLMELGTGHDCRITLPVERGMASEVSAIFHALEQGERDGWHRQDELVRQAITALRHEAPNPPPHPLGEGLHWRPLDDTRIEDLPASGE